MTRSALALLLLVLAAPATAADPKPDTKTDAKTTKDKAKAPPSKVTAQQAMDVRTTKAKFMSAVGSCPRPEDCDPQSPRRNPELVTMLQRAEDAFMLACLQCAADKTCEEERVRIRDGRGRFGYNACMQGEPRTDGKKPK
jgi:hypothetical protein